VGALILVELYRFSCSFYWVRAAGRWRVGDRRRSVRERIRQQPFIHGFDRGAAEENGGTMGNVSSGRGKEASGWRAILERGMGGGDTVPGAALFHG
jgi:hypothetical protein